MARLRSTFTRPGERERQGEGAQELRTLTGPPLLRARARPPSRRGMHLLAGGTPLHCVSILVMLVMMLFHVYVQWLFDARRCTRPACATLVSD